MINIALGPMSPEIVEAVFRYSHVTHIPLMLIASKNQVDYNGGYVNSWTTKTYMDYVKQMRNLYLDADILICRDHCGPGFNGNDDLSDTYRTIESDIKNGFDLLHIDFCHYKGSRDIMLAKIGEAIKYARKLNPRIQFEIGTDEIGKPLNLGGIRSDVESLISVVQPVYYVVNTGSLVKEDKQVGTFSAQNTYNAWSLLRGFNIKVKEHNADYLTAQQISERVGCVDALNVAPELGVRQTETVLALANQYGISTDAFLDVSYKSKKWKKWLQFTSPDDKLTCATLAGHYNFTTKEYQRIIKHLNDYTNVKERIIEETIKIIDRYTINVK